MFTPQKAESSTNPETYTISQGTILYRGDTPFYIANKDRKTDSPVVLKSAPTFFGLASEDVKQYGIIHAWTATKDIKLLHLDNPDVMKGIYDGASDRTDVQTVLRENYGYNPDSNTIGYSNSIFEEDKIFYEYLCKTSVPGYASTRSEGEEISTYEIMVCNPDQDSFIFSGIVFPIEVGDETMYIESEIAKYDKRINPRVDIAGKKNSRPKSVFEFDESPKIKMMALGESPEYRPLRSPHGKSPIKLSSGTPANKGRNLFGDDAPGGYPGTPSQTPSKALFESPGGSKKRKLNKKRKTKRGKRNSRTR